MRRFVDSAYDGGFCVIRRPKLGGVEFHSGVLFSDGKVAQLDSKRGIEFMSVEEFACGRKVEVVRKVDRSLEHQARQRVFLAREQKRAYHVLDWNCETFANWVTGAKPVSQEVGAWTVIALMVAVLVAAGP